MQAPSHSNDRLDETDINRWLVAAGSRARVTVLDQCDSTNTVLAREANAARPNGTVITTEVQSNGRGRRGRTWIAPPGGSLALSMLWHFDRGAAALPGLSLAAGVAVVDAIKRAGGECPVALKWPNDIVCNDAKLGGILVETRIGASGVGPVVAIIGVGINMRLVGADHEALAARGADSAPSQPVTDVASVVTTVPSRNELLSQIVAALAIALAQFEVAGFKAFKTRWQALHVYQGRWVRIVSADGTWLAAQVAGIADDGALIIETASGIRHIHAGEVSLRSDALTDPHGKARDPSVCGASP